MADEQAYTVGNLQLNIQGINTSAIKSIDAVINRLTKLQACIQALDVSKFSTLSATFSQLNTNLSMFSKDSLKGLSSLGTRLQTFSTKLNKIDWTMAQQGFNKLTTAISPFLDKIISAEKGLTQLNIALRNVTSSKLKNISKAIDSTTAPVAKAQKSFNFMLSLSKMWIVYRVARRIGQAIGNIVQRGADYTETLNLWSVAMRNNLDLADKFVNKMNKAYGISEKTLMNAQAIFKNMIGSLGQISEDTAYKLSEAITQMAVDYSSLYNVQLKSAFSKFQAMLAGQVRPIRSVSGYDITETTLFELYQSLGGEKTMRQLNRTEKQLLSIYAVFRQMGASGALGDMSKTLDQFANQSRMMAENFERTMTWAGVIVKYLLQESGIMIYINATLIFFSEVLKAIAQRIGAIDDENTFAPIFESAEKATDAVENLNGSLRDFDKFRSLEDAKSSSVLNIDEKLLQAIAGYSSVIDKANNSAQKLADSWLKGLGFEYINGELTISDKKIDNIIQKIKDFGIFLESTFLTLISYGIANAITSIASSLATAQATIAPLILSVGILFYGLLQFKDAWDDMSAWDRVLNVISAITAGIIGIVVAIKALHLGVIPAIGIGMALSGAVMAISAQVTPKKYADGGMPDKGTMFIAGEAGAEVVYNNSNGQSGVANVRQLKSAFYQALVEYGNTQTDSNTPIQVYLDGELAYETVTSHAKRRGQKWSR